MTNQIVHRKIWSNLLCLEKKYEKRETLCTGKNLKQKKKWSWEQGKRQQRGISEIHKIEKCSL